MSNQNHKTSIGGQALIEGIMMRGPKGSAIAVRLPNKEIEVTPMEEKRFADTHKWAKTPVIRGVVAFVESLTYGYKYLMFTADKSMEDDEEYVPESKLDKWLDEHFNEKAMAVIEIFSMILGLLIAFFLFMYLPAWLVDTFDAHFTKDFLEAHNLHPLFEGILKIIILVIYMYVMSRTKEIKRVFMYHGAEHKTIFCYEAGLPLTVENVRKQIRFHPRCGTSFTIVMLLISILFSTVLVLIFPGIGKIRWLWILAKLLIIPLIMGLGYEFIKYAGRKDNLVSRVLSKPGLWMQRITTIEPTDDMIEVGIAAFNAVRTDNPEDDKIS